MQQVLKFYQLEWLVTNTHVILLLTLLFSSYSSLGQNQQEVSVQLISDIISEDNIIPEWRFKSLAYKVSSGKLTKEDSLKYVNIIRNRKLKLYRYQSNKKAKELLLQDKNEKKKVYHYLSEKDIQTIIDSIPETDIKFDEESFDSIQLIDITDTWDLYHKFSSPIQFDDNKYIIYHYRNVSPANSKLEFIIFCINEENSYEIIKSIILYEH